MSALPQMKGRRIASRLASTSPRRLCRPDADSWSKMPGNYMESFEVML
jgi:hypothetical protein